MAGHRPISTIFERKFFRQRNIFSTKIFYVDQKKFSPMEYFFNQIFLHWPKKNFGQSFLWLKFFSLAENFFNQNFLVEKFREKFIWPEPKFFGNKSIFSSFEYFSTKDILYLLMKRCFRQSNLVGADAWCVLILWFS